jgi:RNA polymerase sigma factor (sigma-70 family)
MNKKNKKAQKTLNKSKNYAVSRQEQVVLKKSTRLLLESNNIESWQASLREGIHIDQIAKHYPNTAQEAPLSCPKWAGGNNEISTKKPKKDWSNEEIKELCKLAKNKQLLPWEAALKYNQPIKRIIKTLLKQEFDINGLKASPTWIPKWARYETGGIIGDYSNKMDIPEEVSSYQEKLDIEEISRNNLEVLKSYRESLNMTTKKGSWNQSEREDLKHYWKLELLGSEEIAYLINRQHPDTLKMASELNLKKKHVVSTEEWCGVKWEFEVEGKGDPKALPPNLQRLVAEASATRFSLLYEKLKAIKESDKNYKSIERELNQILALHTRIFSKYLSTRSRKYKYVGTSAWQVQKDLEQAGRTAIFECLRRWHPNRNIRFSRGTVNIAINREMLAWLEQQRLVDLPDKIRSVARQLKHAFDNGKWDSEVKRLKKKAGENCVKEAAKHQNTYAYLHTVPLMETYNENDAEFGGVTGGAADCVEEFTAVCMPESDTDITSLLLDACNKIPENERRAVLSYHGLDCDGNHIGQKTLEEIGLMEGVTKERIRQRILKGKQRMRKWLERINIRSVGDALAAV